MSVDVARRPVQMPEKVYEFLRLKDGDPADPSGNPYDMVTPYTESAPSRFQYSPTTRVVIFRFNIVLCDSLMQYGKFAGLEALTNGCTFMILDTDETTILGDFYNEVTIKRNEDFSALAGVDAVAKAIGAGGDMLPVRFTIGKSGGPLKMKAGQFAEWTNNDDLTGLSYFRIMAQGQVI